MERGSAQRCAALVLGLLVGVALHALSSPSAERLLPLAPARVHEAHAQHLPPRPLHLGHEASVKTVHKFVKDKQRDAMEVDGMANPIDNMASRHKYWGEIWQDNLVCCHRLARLVFLSAWAHGRRHT